MLRICSLRSIGKQSRESMESVLKKKRRLRWEWFAEKEGFNLSLEWKSKGVMDDESVEWTESTEEAPLIWPYESESKRLVHGWQKEAASWFQRCRKAHWKERSTIRKDDVDVRVSVTKYEERVLRGRYEYEKRKVLTCLQYACIKTAKHWRQWTGKLSKHQRLAVQTIGPRYFSAHKEVT